MHRADELAESLMATFDGPLKAPEGLPAFQASSRSGRIIQGARGCGNSGILLFAGELARTVGPLVAVQLAASFGVGGLWRVIPVAIASSLLLGWRIQYRPG